MPLPAPDRPLRYLYPGWYAIVMGLTGLALAWHRAEPLMGEMAGVVAWLAGGLAAAVFAVLAGATVLRGWRYPEAWAEDRRHPVRHTFVAALPVAAMLVATVGVALLGPHPLLAALWWAGSLGQFGVTVWVLGRWWGRPAWPSVTPALFIPIVGNVLAPLAGVPLGAPLWSAAQFGIGLILWPVVLTLIVVRLAVQGAWPDRLKPTAFIVIAPPAVIATAALQLGAPVLLAWMGWGIALFCFLWAATQARAIAAMPFGIAYWAMSFPLASFAALTLRLAEPGTPMAVLGPVLLALASLVILGLCFATVRGLRDGSLLAPEPVAPIVPAAATA
jgi:tellurite resistance protein